eukprot:7557003-Alexandrium_andersonii.AAC.1
MGISRTAPHPGAPGLFPGLRRLPKTPEGAPRPRPKWPRAQRGTRLLPQRGKERPLAWRN